MSKLKKPSDFEFLSLTAEEYHTIQKWIDFELLYQLNQARYVAVEEPQKDMERLKKIAIDNIDAILLVRRLLYIDYESSDLEETISWE